MSLLDQMFDIFRRSPASPSKTGNELPAGAQYAPGDRIGGVYEMRGVLGVGGFSVVYLVYSRETQTLYALKTLRDEFLKDEGTRAQFRKEAKLWIGLERHPNIVQAGFIADLDGRLYIGMEYVPPDASGINTLDGYLTQRPPNLTQAVRWSIQFCHGMEYARSRGIRCHRDVKPANIMITPDGTVKITDFGFADVISPVTESSPASRRHRHHERSGFGTPTYMPPEQFRNALRCDERSDVYSFGIVLYQMATRGRLPFSSGMRKKHFGHDVVAMWNEMHRLHTEAPVPPLGSPLFPIIKRCLQKEQSARYQTFGALRTDLEDLLKKQSGAVETASGAQKLESWELYNKAFSLSSLGSYEEAIACYDRVTELEPDNADAWNNKGTCFRKLKKPGDAVHCYDKAISAKPDDPAAWRNRGSSHYALGRFDQAVADLSRACQLDPANASAWLHRGMAEERLNRASDAARSFRKYLELNPAQAQAQVEYARKRLAVLEHH